MITRVNEWIENHEEELMEEMSTLIGFPGVKSAAAGEGAPFGMAIKETLDFMLQKAESYGFSCVNMEGYIGYSDYIGTEDKELMGILAHLDVVPVDDNWNTDPFEAVVKEGKIFGRGTMDDKGPALAALFAMRALRECGFEPRKSIRLILGCDEESGMECLKYYCEHGKIPDFSISPDAMYPVVNSEKNIYVSPYIRKFEADTVSEIEIQCGEKSNIVPSKARAVLPFEQSLVEEKISKEMKLLGYEYDICMEEEKTVLYIYGISCHASLPESGKNALQGLLHALKCLPLTGVDKLIVDTIYEAFALEYNGQSVGLDISDTSGNTTINLGVLNWDKNSVRLAIDMRLPHCVTKEVVDLAINSVLEKALLMKDTNEHFSPGIYFEEESEFIQTLLKVYQSVTNDMETRPIQIGGGTYARQLPNAVAFGTEFPDDENVVHKPNEYITVEKLVLNVKILAKAIIELTQ